VTVASLLCQFDLATSRRAALGLMIVNLLGGIAASFAFLIIEIWPLLASLFLVVFLVALLFGHAAASNATTGKIYAGALTTFLILLGLGVSPLPTSTPESFTTRITYVAFAIAYTVVLITFLWPRDRRIAH